MKTFLRIAIILAVSACCSRGKKAPPTGEAATNTSSAFVSGPVVPAIAAKRDFKDRPQAQLAAKQILDEYKSNEVRADGAYKDTIVQIQGIVGDIKKDVTDNIYVMVGTGEQFELQKVQCFVKSGEEKAAAALNKGDDVTVMGRVNGLLMNVIVKECVINPAMRLCDKFRVAYGGDGTCEMNNAGAFMETKDKLTFQTTCAGNKEQYDRMISDLPRSPDKKVAILLSEQSLCITITAGDKPLFADVIAKAQKALDSL